MIPYSRQAIDEDDIKAVVEVLRSDWLTTGPKVAEFEETFASYVNTQFAVAVSSGTASLHAAMHALNICQGDEVIVPAITFAATANCIVYQSGTPIFADVYPDTLLIDPDSVRRKITGNTRAIIAVDYAGQACDYDSLRAIAKEYGLALVGDACHSIGGNYKGRAIGSLADMTVFSFHPVKLITTGEGGMIVTNDPVYADKMRIFRNHGISADHKKREEQGSWFYEIEEIGYNYRLTDFQCALGRSQLAKLPQLISNRQDIAMRYDDAFKEISAIKPLKKNTNISHAYHLYVVKLDLAQLTADRSVIFSALRAEGIGVNVHYIPVHMHPFYRRRFGTGPGLCPVAEAAYELIFTLPIYSGMTVTDVDTVINAVCRVIEAHKR